MSKLSKQYDRSLWTYLDWLKALKEGKIHYRLTPRKWRTKEELNLAAVEQWGFNLEFIPLAARTLPVCKAALTKASSIWRHVPLLLRGSEEIQQVIREDHPRHLSNMFQEFTQEQLSLSDDFSHRMASLAR